MSECSPIKIKTNACVYVIRVCGVYSGVHEKEDNERRKDRTKEERDTERNDIEDKGTPTKEEGISKKRRREVCVENQSVYFQILPVFLSHFFSKCKVEMKMLLLSVFS